MNRDRFFCGLFILAAANGLVYWVVGTVVAQGWSDAVLGLFSVSAFVWVAALATSVLLYGSTVDEVITTPDTVIGLGVLAMAILPFPKLSWLALTALSLHMLCVSTARSSRRRAALIGLAITGPMLWGRVLIDVFGPAILQADAILVSTLIGTDYVGNVFLGAIGSDGIPTQFAIYPACSSLHGMSIAVLAFVTINNTFGSVAWSARHFACAVLAVLSVLAVNVLRLGLIGLFPTHYSAIHGSPGGDIAAWLSLALVVAISLFGVGRDPFVRT